MRDEFDVQHLHGLQREFKASMGNLKTSFLYKRKRERDRKGEGKGREVAITEDLPSMCEFVDSISRITKTKQRQPQMGLPKPSHTSVLRLGGEI